MAMTYIYAALSNLQTIAEMTATIAAYAVPIKAAKDTVFPLMKS